MSSEASCCDELAASLSSIGLLSKVEQQAALVHGSFTQREVLTQLVRHLHARDNDLKLLARSEGRTAATTINTIAQRELANPSATDESPCWCQQPAVVVPTSGSTTGVPRLAVHSRRSLLRGVVLLAGAPAPAERQVLFQPYPMDTIGGITASLSALAEGVELLLDPYPGVRRFAEVLAEPGVARAAVPSPLAPAVLAVFDRLFEPTPMARVAVGGAHTSDALLEALHERFGGLVIDGYGLTETAGAVMVRFAGQAEMSVLHAEVSASLDPEGSELLIELPAGQKFLGYLTQNPETLQWGIEAHHGKIRTGDIAAASALTIRIVGRVDGSFSRNGVILTLEEVEGDAKAIVGHDTRVACTTSVGHRGRLQLLLAVEVGDSDIDAVRELIMRNMPPATRPHIVGAVDALPTTDTGKLDRSKIETLLLGGSPE